jgi:FtsH-binding integral membrane protein
MMYANAAYPFPSAQSDVRGFVTRVYAWMFIALAVTGLTALLTVSTPAIRVALLNSEALYIGLLLAEIVLVIALTAAVNRMAPTVATGVFLFYSVLNGVTLSLIVLVYTAESISVTFFITAGTFGLMSVYGFVTKRDLTSIGNLLIMGLIGFLLASVVNLFLRSTPLYWVLTYAGILIFVGLTAYDAQRIKQMAETVDEHSDQGKRAAIIGALRLYLDFINLFLLLLRLFGRRK